MKKIVAKIKEAFSRFTAWMSGAFQAILSRIKKKSGA